MSDSALEGEIVEYGPPHKHVDPSFYYGVIVARPKWHYEAVARRRYSASWGSLGQGMGGKLSACGRFMMRGKRYDF